MKSTFNIITTGCTTRGMYDIPEAYSVYISCCISISTFTILLYSTTLKLPQEIEYIWLKRSSLPAFLYILTKYGALFNQGLALVVSLGITTTRLCVIPNLMAAVFYILLYIGTQGLLIARAYAVSKRSKILVGVLVVGCIIGLIASILDYSTLGSLGTKLSKITNTSFIFTDLVAFWVSTRNVWNTWKLKRKAGLQSSNDISTVLLRQSIIRCSLVVVFTVTSVVSNQVSVPTMVTHAIEESGVVLVAVIVADFILDLRQCNYTATDASIMTLPTIRFQNILQHVHQSLIVELRTPICNMEEGDSENDGISESSHNDQSVSARAQDPAVLELAQNMSNGQEVLFTFQ